jgi:hypothetical protein
MKNPQFVNSRVHPIAKTTTITIEPAEECDGSTCHQPLFDEDGGLHYVAPHCHLIEWKNGIPHYHVVLCDFPLESADLKQVR